MKATHIYLAIGLISLTCSGAIALDQYDPVGIPSKLNLEIKTSGGAIAEVRNMLMTFANSENMEIAEFSSKMPPKERTSFLYLTFDKANKVELVVTGDYMSGRIFIDAYNPGRDGDFPGLLSRLTAALEKKWKVRRRQS